MSTTLGNLAELMAAGAPRVIRSEAQLKHYTEALFDLTSKNDPTENDIEAIEVLTVLIEHFETKRYPVAKASGPEVLRLLLEQNNLSQKDLLPEMGSDSAVSFALNGKRPLTRSQIARLAERFRVSPEVFL